MRKREKYLIAILACLGAMALVFTACGKGSSAGSSGTGTNVGNTIKNENDVHIERMFTLPADGEEIAVMTTSMGTIKLKFFPEDAPKAVENFKAHARDGYYNGSIFQNVVTDQLIQGGGPAGDPTGGQSIWGTPFEDEYTWNLWNFRGALSMANDGADTNGSQFFIVQASKVDNATLKKLKDANFPQKVIDKYGEIGGLPGCDSKNTVFGTVFEGMDVVDAIAAVPVSVQADGSKKPLTDVVIQTVEIVPYTSASSSSAP